MDLSALAQLSLEQLQSALPAWLAGHLTDPDAAAANRARVQAVLDGWTRDDVDGVLEALQELGTDRRMYPALPLCRDLSRVWCHDLMPVWEADGIDAIAALDRPIVLLGNHQSYFDSTAIDAILAWSGHARLADRVVSIAGPKVYETLFRRLASASLNTLPVPQSASLGHTAQISPRELARQARASLDESGRVLDDGYALLLYAEGSRTRTGRLGPFLKGAHRYLDTRPGVLAVPTALVGTQRIMPIGDTRLTPATVSLRLGEPVDVEAVGGSRAALEIAHQRLGALLPDALAPAPETPPVA